MDDMSDQNPPAMFAGVKPPPPREQPKAGDSAKPADRVAATKASGAPAGRFALGSAVPLLMLIGVVLWVTVDPVVALIVVGALVAIGGIAMLARSAARRRVATTTRVRPDGSTTTTTKPFRRPGRNGGRRFPGQRTPRSRGRDGASNPDGHSRWPSRQTGGSPGGRGGGGDPARGGRPGGGQPRGAGQPDGTKRSFRDRMTGRNKDGSAPKSPGGKGGRQPSGGPGGRQSDAAGQPAGQKPTGKSRSRWPRSRKNQGGGLPPKSGGNGGSPGGKSPGGSGPGGGSNGGSGPKPKSPGKGGNRWSKSRAPKKNAGGDRSKLPRSLRQRWQSAWADEPAQGKPARKDKPDQSGDKLSAADGAHRKWWPGRGGKSEQGGEASDSQAQQPRRRRWPATDEDGYRRWIPRGDRSQRPKETAAQADRRLHQEGMDQLRADDRSPDPRAWRSKKPIADDPQQPAPTREESALADEAALMSGWSPDPTGQSRQAPRPTSKGGNTMSDSGLSESSVAAGTAQAYEAAQGDARTGSTLASNTANMLRADAANLPNTPRMAPHAAELGRQAGKWARVSAVYDVIASKLGQSAARHQGGERLQ